MRQTLRGAEQASASQISLLNLHLQAGTALVSLARLPALLQHLLLALLLVAMQVLPLPLVVLAIACW
jgi:hypothetical protein